MSRSYSDMSDSLDFCNNIVESSNNLLAVDDLDNVNRYIIGAREFRSFSSRERFPYPLLSIFGDYQP
jgi:hypothetical protein